MSKKQEQHPSLKQTRALVRTAHAGQTDLSGKPYHEHPERVEYRLRLMFPRASAAERHAALLHDVIEDTELTFGDLEAKGYGAEVIEILKLVTRDKSDGLTYQHWIDRICRSNCLGAIRVKLADNIDNQDPVRIAALPPEMRSIEHRYSRALGSLIEALDELNDLPAIDSRLTGPEFRYYFPRDANPASPQAHLIEVVHRSSLCEETVAWCSSEEKAEHIAFALEVLDKI